MIEREEVQDDMCGFWYAVEFARYPLVLVCSLLLACTGDEVGLGRLYMRKIGDGMG